MTAIVQRLDPKLCRGGQLGQGTIHKGFSTIKTLMFDTRHPRSRGSGKPGETVTAESVDAGILPLVEALTAAGCSTWGSCEGHFSEDTGCSMPYVSFDAGPGVIQALQDALAGMWQSNSAKLPWSLRFARWATGGSIWTLGVHVDDIEDDVSVQNQDWDELESAHLLALEHDVGVLAESLKPLAHVPRSAP